MSKTLEIPWDQYSDESNDPMETGRNGRALTLGPLKPDGSGDRIPYSGYEDGEYRYVLIGWPKKLQAPKTTFNRDIVAWLQKHLGKGYPIFNNNVQTKDALKARIDKVGWQQVKNDWAKAKELGLGSVQAIQYAAADPVETPKMKVSEAIPPAKAKAVTETKVTAPVMGLEGLGE